MGLARSLYESNQEEKKFRVLAGLLQSQGVLDGNEKLVIFTEHKDTLDYLDRRLRNSGYEVVTIHGGMPVDERRAAQLAFAGDARILVATDAAGEGINLQFCRLLINWDIPWNPNRLEQRMGRIHRYGQDQDVLVFNLVAENTREGNVLERLLTKLDSIRDQLGDDRVYDVISDIFEGVDLNDVVNATLGGERTAYTAAIDEELTEENVRDRIREQREGIGHTEVDYGHAKDLKERSDEKRLHPVYVRLFFEKAFAALGGRLAKAEEMISRVKSIPESVAEMLRASYNIASNLADLSVGFDKQVFLGRQSATGAAGLHYISPGSPLFDTVLEAVRRQFHEHMLQGTILVSPEDKDSYLAYLVKSQITDNRPHGEDSNVADERIVLVQQLEERGYVPTMPAKLLDLHPPADFAKEIIPPERADSGPVVEWCFENVTLTQRDEAQRRVDEDVGTRREYVEEAFTNIVMDLTAEINELQRRSLLGDEKAAGLLEDKQKRIVELQRKRKQRMQEFEMMLKLSIRAPTVLGCAYVVPLSQVEYERHYGMTRDDEAEVTAMQEAMAFERDQGRNAEDVSEQDLGYDIRSASLEGLKRYIEVKGRNVEGAVMISENEMNRLTQLGTSAWLYVVTHCATTPELYRIKDPGNTIDAEERSKGVQYYVPEAQWRARART